MRNEHFFNKKYICRLSAKKVRRYIIPVSRDLLALKQNLMEVTNISLVKTSVLL